MYTLHLPQTAEFVSAPLTASTLTEPEMIYNLAELSVSLCWEERRCAEINVWHMYQNQNSSEAQNCDSAVMYATQL